MKLVKVSKEFYELCEEKGVSQELLFNEAGRPCVLIVKLTYRGQKRDFVVPLRSNISPYAPKEQFFALPPNTHTKPKHYHGIHYMKIFPISKKYIQKYLIDKNPYYVTLKNIIDANEKEIVNECQKYLEECEKGNKNPITPNIDGIIAMISELLK